MGRPTTHSIVNQMLALMRLLNELAPDSPYEQGEPVAVSEIARRLGITPEQVRRAIELLNVCGEALPGYFVDYDEQSDTVAPLRMDMAIDRVIGLTPREAMALLTALDAMGFDRDDPLVETLRQACPPLTGARITGAQTQAASKGLADTLGALSQAIVEHCLVRMAYRGTADTAPRIREVEPQSLTYDLEEMAWYLSAWCRTAGGWRTFRVDRTSGVKLLDETFASRLEGTSGDALASFLEGAQVATLAVHDPSRVGDASPDGWRGLARVDVPDERFLAALSPQERKAGAFVATIPWVASQPWLARMIAATFGGVEALDPPELRTQVRAQARTLLAQL